MWPVLGEFSESLTPLAEQQAHDDPDTEEVWRTPPVLQFLRDASWLARRSFAGSAPARHPHLLAAGMKRSTFEVAEQCVDSKAGNCEQMLHLIAKDVAESQRRTPDRA